MSRLDRVFELIVTPSTQIFSQTQNYFLIKSLLNLLVKLFDYIYILEVKAFTEGILDTSFYHFTKQNILKSSYE